MDATALAAATSLASRYVSTLRSSATPSKLSRAGVAGVVSGPCPPEGLYGSRTYTGLTCCGRDAADAAVTVESPEFMAVLTAWEAAKATTGTAVVDGEAEASLATEGTDVFGGPGSTMEGLAPEAPIDGRFVRGNEDSNSSSERHHKEEQEENRQGERRMVGSLAGAAEILRALDEEADPQGALCLGGANAWVVKPAGLSCGRGVEVVSSLQGLVAACRRLEWKAVVQKYVERPLLVQVSPIFLPHTE